ncbi:MAG: pseudouridine synthase [Chloroflexi bacterium]|nr:pseudouridine synthase [Chloroflexota bacterium]MBT17713.1 pseudouridine synthase [Dehalococcoidia bacterium]
MEQEISVLKYLVSSGIGSRRVCASLIMKGEVKANGQLITSLKHLISNHDLLEVSGQQISIGQTKKVHLILNKPKGYLSSVSDDRNRPTVLDLVPEKYKVPGLVPAGRLDYLSSGLMILTNDGDLVYRITHPKFKIEKEYLVFLDKPLLESDIQKLTRGYKIESGFARVLAVKTINRSNNQYSIVLNEGKKREIRLLIKGLGIHVKDLQRVRIGQIRLGRLASMDIAPMTKLQIESLR